MVTTKKFVLGLAAMLGLFVACDAGAPDSTGAESVASSDADIIVGPNGLIHSICTETFAGDQWRTLGSAIYRDYASGRECLLSSLNQVGDLDAYDPEQPNKPTYLRIQAVTLALEGLGCAPPPNTLPGTVVGHARWVWTSEGAIVGGQCVPTEQLDPGAWEVDMRFVDRDENLMVVETQPDFLPNRALLANPLWFFGFKNNEPGRAQFSINYPGPNYEGGWIREDPACTVSSFDTNGFYGLHTCDTLPSRGGDPHETSAGSVINNRFDFPYPEAPPPNYPEIGPFQTTGWHIGRGGNQNLMISVAAEKEFIRKFKHTASPLDPDVGGVLTPEPNAKVGAKARTQAQTLAERGFRVPGFGN
jgi:hypothetical protein